VQNEEHVLSDCPGTGLANLNVKQHQLFHSPFRIFDRLKGFLSQANIKGLALFLCECLEPCANILAQTWLPVLVSVADLYIQL